jgi:hypothetical protein
MTATTANRLAKPGDYVIIRQCQYVSGVSSIPHALPTGEYIGTLTQVSDIEYALIDDDGVQVATISRVYGVTESMSGHLLLRGWVGDVWSCWNVEL